MDFWKLEIGDWKFEIRRIEPDETVTPRYARFVRLLAGEEFVLVGGEWDDGEASLADQRGI